MIHRMCRVFTEFLFAGEVGYQMPMLCFLLVPGVLCQFEWVGKEFLCCRVDSCKGKCSESLKVCLLA